MTRKRKTMPFVGRITGRPREKVDGYTTAVGLRLAERVVQARIARGWTQGELAERCGWTEATVAYIEAGHDPKLGKLLILCRVLEIPWSDLENEHVNLG